MEGVDEKLRQLDQEIAEKIEAMLRAEPPNAFNVEKTSGLVDSETTNDNSTEVLSAIQGRKKKQMQASHHNEAQLFQEDEERLNEVKQGIEDQTEVVYQSLLNLFQQGISFNSGVERFTQVLSEQLILPDVAIKTDKLQIIQDKFTDVKTTILLLNTLTNQVYKEDLRLLELDLYQKILYNFFQLQSKDLGHNLQTETQQVLKEGFRSLHDLIQKNIVKQNELLHTVLKKTK